MKKRILSMILAVLLVVGMLPISVFAADPIYLAIGDSISTGF